MRYPSLVFSIIILISSLYGQQGVYKRKSVSTLDAFWVKPGAKVNTQKIDMKILNNFMEFYIEIPRFDFNELPKKQVKSFLEQADALDNVDSQTLSEVMEQTIVKDILQILNDPEVQNSRSKNFKNESDFETFAATKAKSMGLTAEQLGSLMNSAYIYLPYIDRIETKKEKSDLNVDISGGIIWWKVQVTPSGDASVKKVLDATTSSSNIIDLDAKELLTDKKRKYDEYSFGENTFKTTPETYVQGDAMLAFAKNLSIKTRELSDFKLQAQIAEKNRSKYNFNLGLADGVHLDDGFFLVEYSEDAAGKETMSKIGYLRISKTGDNKKDPLALSSAKQLYGDKGDVGSVVMEHPRIGVDTRIRLGNRVGMYIHPIHTYGLTDDIAEDAFMFDIDFSYNLAPIVNISQTFFDIGLSMGMLNAPLSATAKEELMVPLIFDIGLGVSKKIWVGRMNAPIGLSYHYQSLSMVSEKEEISILGDAASISAGFEYMINANTIFHIGFDYNIPFGVSKVKYKNSDYDYDYEYTSDEDLARWNEESDDWYGVIDPLSLGGLNIKIGIDYSLGESSVDLFGFLDPMKKY